MTNDGGVAIFVFLRLDLTLTLNITFGILIFASLYSNSAGCHSIFKFYQNLFVLTGNCAIVVERAAILNFCGCF